MLDRFGVDFVISNNPESTPSWIKGKDLKMNDENGPNPHN
jgi:hypothetical protein